MTWVTPSPESMTTPVRLRSPTCFFTQEAASDSTAYKYRTINQCSGSGMFLPDPDFYPSRIRNTALHGKMLRIRDSESGMGKKSKSGSGICLRDEMNIPDHISESLETIFWVKNRYSNSLMWIRLRDPESFYPLIRDGYIPIWDPQHWHGR
jgi:hypothetical protein